MQTELLDREQPEAWEFAVWASWARVGGMDVRDLGDNSVTRHAWHLDEDVWSPACRWCVSHD